MEDAAATGSPPPETMDVPSPRGQKRGAPDEGKAAGDGAARGSPRRAGVVDAAVDDDEEEASMEFVEEEDDELEEPEDDAHALPARELFDFFHVHPGADGDGDASAGSSAADQEPVDVTLRLGVGAVDTTLRLGSAAPGAAALGEEDEDDLPSLSDDDLFVVRVEANLSHASPAPASGDEYSYTIADYYANATAVDDAAGRPSSGLDLNQRCTSESPDGAADPSPVPDPAPVVDDHEADVGERPAATVEPRRQSPAPFIDFFCSPAQAVRAPGVLTAADSC